MNLLYHVITVPLVFIGAFPLSQDFEFDLKLNSFNVSPKIKTPWNLTFQVTGLLREFTKKCGEEAIQELNTQKRRFQNLGIGSRFGFSWGGSALVKLGSWNMGGAVVIFDRW